MLEVDHAFDGMVAALIAGGAADTAGRSVVLPAPRRTKRKRATDASTVASAECRQRQRRLLRKRKLQRKHQLQHKPGMKRTRQHAPGREAIVLVRGCERGIRVSAAEEATPAAVARDESRFFFGDAERRERRDWVLRRNGDGDGDGDGAGHVMEAGPSAIVKLRQRHARKERNAAAEETRRELAQRQLQRQADKLEARMLRDQASDESKAEREPARPERRRARKRARRLIVTVDDSDSEGGLDDGEADDPGVVMLDEVPARASTSSAGTVAGKGTATTTTTSSYRVMRSRDAFSLGLDAEPGTVPGTAGTADFPLASARFFRAGPRSHAATASYLSERSLPS